MKWGKQKDDELPFISRFLRNPADFENIRAIKKPNASKHYLEGPTKNLSHNAKKRPARCEETISPDTFHLLCDSANTFITWSVFEIFAEI